MDADILKNPTLNIKKLHLKLDIKIDVHKIDTILISINQAYLIYRFYNFRSNIWAKWQENCIEIPFSVSLLLNQSSLQIFTGYLCKTT